MEISKIYELILHYKSETETRRDEINKYYTSLFAALISLMPFIDKIAGIENIIDRNYYNVKYVLILLSCLGLILSISWKLVLQRILIYIKGTEELLAQMEKTFEVGFISYMFNYLGNFGSPARVTKHQMLVPNTFIIIFSITLIYSIFW